MNEGIEIILSTGRPFNGMKRYKDMIENDNYSIVFNGAIIADTNGNFIYNKVIDSDISKSILNLYKKYDVYLHVYSGERYIVSEPDFYYERYIEREKITDTIIGLDNINNFEFSKMVFIGDRDELEKLQNDIRNNFNVHTSFSHTNFLEVLASGINKGTALEWLCNKKGISREEIIAFGDNYNDIEMIEYAGIGVAVGNAEESVKKSADYVCLTNYEDGVGRLPDWAFGGFERPENVNPVISPIDNTWFYCPLTEDSVAWESNDTFNPAATIYDEKIVVLYRAEDKSGIGIGRRTSRLGYATSVDGVTFQRRSTPVFYPDNDLQKSLEWPGGCEDPRIAVTVDGLYVMMYTQWNRDIPRLAVATSKDLVHWTKYGPAFAKAYDGKFYNMACKSGSILTELIDGRQVIKKVGGKYFMYWGEEHVFAATSEDLVNWTPIVNIDGSLKRLFSPRDGYFDSQLTECGPPAIYTPKGIVLLYNGKNHSGKGDKRYTPNVYAAGQALFDANDPTHLISRLDEPFFRPMDSFEKSGQYVDGTVFIEGMVYFKGKWYLYYGCADSKVGVAVYDPKNPSLPDPLP